MAIRGYQLTIACCSTVDLPERADYCVGRGFWLKTIESNMMRHDN